MALFHTGTAANVRRQARSAYFHVLSLLALMLGVGWSLPAFASIGSCDLQAVTVTPITSSAGATVSISYNVLDSFNCDGSGGISLSIGVGGDSTGGATVNPTSTSNLVGSHSFTTTVGPTTGSYTVTLNCTANCSTTSTLTWVVNAPGVSTFTLTPTTATSFTVVEGQAVNLGVQYLTNGSAAAQDTNWSVNTPPGFVIQSTVTPDVSGNANNTFYSYSAGSFQVTVTGNCPNAVPTCPPTPVKFNITVETPALTVITPAGGSGTQPKNTPLTLSVRYGGPTVPVADGTDIEWSVIQEPSLGATVYTPPLFGPPAFTRSTTTNGVATIDFTGTAPGKYKLQAGYCPDGCNDTIPITITVPFTYSMTVAKVLKSYTDADRSGNVSLGDVLIYTVTATNTGDGPLTNVAVTDPLTSPNATLCARIPIGGTCTLTGSYTVTATDVAAGSISNTGSAISTEISTPTTDTANTPVFGSPSMTVDKVLASNADGDGSGSVTLGDVLTYTVTAANTGNIPLTGVVVSDPLISPSSNNCASVAIGNTCVLTGTYTVTSADVTAGSISNTGSAISNEVAGPINSTVRTRVFVFGNPGMTVSKVLASNADADGSGTVTLGDVLTYTVTATNTGNVPLTNVVVTDPLTSPSSNNCASVPVAGTCVLTGTYTVIASDVTAGSISNTGSATSNEVPGPLNSTVRTKVYGTAGMTVSKTLSANADGDHSGTVSEGDVLTYKVTATNTGGVPLTNVAVSDTMIAPSSANCATVAVTARCVLTGNYTVTAADVTAGTISNTGSATSNEVPGPVNQTVNTPVASSPAMTVVKVLASNADGDSSGSVTEGDVLTYTVTATNTGNVALTGVVVNDSLISPSSNNCATVAIGNTCVLTGTYTVTSADVTAGSVSNTGSATSNEVGGPISSTVRTPVVSSPAMTVLKQLTNNADGDGTGNVSLGDVLTYTITATNIGNVTLTNVLVGDPLIRPLSITCPSVAVGNTCVLTGTHTVSASDVTAGTITNTGSASSNQVPGPITNTVNTPVVSLGPPTLSADSGDDQSGVLGSVANLPLVAELKDGLGAPIAGKVVSWTVQSGPATVTPSSVTDSNGLAQATLTFGNSTGAIVIHASALAGTATVDFTATSVNVSLAPASGDNQVGPINTALPLPLVVQITPPPGITSAGGGGGKPQSLSGVPITFAVAGGGGSLSVTSTTTNASGQASTILTLGPAPGPNSVTATVTGGPSTTFHATAVAPGATLSIVSGNNQTLPTNTLSAPLVVALKDSSNNPIAGATINWSASNGSLTAASSITDAAGHASNTVSIDLPGAASVSASSTAPAAGPVSFALNGGVAGLSGLTPQQQAIADAIDALCPALAADSSLTPKEQDLLNRCLDIVNAAGLDPDATIKALEELFADVAMAEANAAFQAAQAQFQNLKARIAALRSGTGGTEFGGLALNGPGGTLPLGSLIKALTGDDDKAPTGEVGTDFSRWGFFASGTIGRGEAKRGEVNPAYNYDVTGLTAGLDYRKSDKWIIGGAVGYTNQNTDLPGNNGTVDASGWSLSAYSTYYQPDSWYLDSVLTWGHNSFDTDRKIHYTLPLPGGGTTTVNTRARGSAGGELLDIAATFGRDFQKGAWSIGPYGRATYTRLTFDTMDEKLPAGVGSGLGLAIEGRTLTSVASVLGTKVTYAHSAEWGVLMPHFQFEWEHEFKDDPQALTARFLNDPTHTPMSVTGDKVDTDYFRMGFGLSMVLTKGRSGFFYYERMFARSGLSQDNLAVGVRIEF